MMLNSFAPPFKLVGGYFVAGFLFLFLSVVAYFWADFGNLTALKTAGFLHIFFVGFVISIIIGALYQLTSVILEKPFFSVKFAISNLLFYVVSLLSMSYGMIGENMNFMYFGGILLFLSLLFFGITYLLSFIGNQKRSFAAFALFASAIFLIIGIILGFCLLMIFLNYLTFSFDIVLKFHIYFVLGFVFFIIIGVATVLLPMFSLAHNLNFNLSKIAFVLYICAGFFIAFDEFYAFLIILAALLSFVFEAIDILTKRVRKAYDYWNLNIAVALTALVIFCVLFAAHMFEIAIFALVYGFLLAFIVAHVYKILPFLVWYHYVAPFVGKMQVPLLDNMVIKKIAYFAIFLNVLSLIFYVFASFYEVYLLKFFSVGALLVSIFLVAINMINIFKFTKFGEENGRKNL
ncbi:MAG: peptidase M50 [Campylobacter sp.]